MTDYFVTGIGTDVGKTIVAAVLTEALEADYWKPVQAGDLDRSDSIQVGQLITNTKSRIHQEAYRLTQPMSPHAAARIDGVEIQLESIHRPETSNRLIIEGAGGLMVPLNDKRCIIDLIRQLDVEVILVSQNYLGSINHTLLSIDALKHRNIPVKGIIFNGAENSESEQFILNTGIQLLGRLNHHERVTKETVASYKSRFSSL
ncbi:MAG: dethiobiotin synthase [Flavobacteriales bacterium]|nr:dethiobiotin synthase [Flavobacteriales bacterium]